MQADSNPKGVFVGIDNHSRSLQVCVLDQAGQILVNRPVPNDCPAVADLASRFGRVRRAALEAGSGSADLAEQLIQYADWSVELAHPGYVARMKASPDKHDLGDAHLLADLTRVGYLPRVWLAPPWVRELRRLVRYRQQQVDERRNARLRIGALLRDHRVRPPVRVNAWTQAWWYWLETEVIPELPARSAWIIPQQVKKIEWLSKEVRRAETQLRRHTNGDRLIERLLEESGVGVVTAWVLRAEIGRFDRFDRGKALSRFCGLSPRNASSGERQADAGMIKAGSPLLRATLIELAHRLPRCEDRWQAYRQQLLAAGKPGSVVAAAVANRWIRGLYYRMVQGHGDVAQEPLNESVTGVRVEC